MADAAAEVRRIASGLRLVGPRFGDPELVALLRALEATNAPLAVIGAEGAGKSTLINALLGVEVTPPELQEAGTALPIKVSYGDCAEPEYSIDGQPVSPEEFRKRVLHRHHPGTLPVGRAEVRVRSPLLASGLVLVDVPGVAGLSAREAELALPRVRRAILVVRDRSYGPASRLIEQWADRLVIEAVVSNWSLDFWRADPQTLAKRVAAQRNLIRRHLDLDLPDERIFVVHLPTVQGDFMGTGGSALLKQTLHASVRRLHQIVKERLALLDADRPLPASLAQDCRSTLDSTFGEILDTAGFAELEAAQRSHLLTLFGSHRDSLLASIAEVTKTRAEVTYLDLDGRGTDSWKSLQHKLSDATTELASQGRAAAEHLIRASVQPFTLAVDSLLSARLPVDPDATMAIHLGQSPQQPPPPGALSAWELVDPRRRIDRLVEAAQALLSQGDTSYADGQLAIVRPALLDAAHRYLDSRLTQLRPAPPDVIALYESADRDLTRLAAASI